MDTDFDNIRLHFENIAKSEITRHRRRLGRLTYEQRAAIEQLLTVTAGLISYQVIQGIQKYELSRESLLQFLLE